MVAEAAITMAEAVAPVLVPALVLVPAAAEQAAAKRIRMKIPLKQLNKTHKDLFTLPMGCKI